jgi:hypothetical protein
VSAETCCGQMDATSYWASVLAKLRDTLTLGGRNVAVSARTLSLCPLLRPIERPPPPGGPCGKTVRNGGVAYAVQPDVNGGSELLIFVRRIASDHATMTHARETRPLTRILQ